MKTLTDFLSPKIVRSLKLLYRASEHNFSTTDFHQCCDVVPNTLTLVKTEFGNVIGGFTPLTWNRARDGHYEPDSLLDTFLFSLTLKQKMLLTNPSRAIANDANFGPVFGAGHDLAIADHANRNANSVAEFPTSYNNGYNKSQ
jgi:hypothetical protein